MASVLEDILVAVQSGITGLSLTGLSSTAVVVQKVASVRPADLPKFDPQGPVVVVAPLGQETLTPTAGTNLRDDIVYPVLVAILAPDLQSQTIDRDKYLTWRQSIRRKFHHNTSAFTSLSSVINSIVQPQAIIDTQAFFERNSLVSALLIQVTSREARS